MKLFSIGILFLLFTTGLKNTALSQTGTRPQLYDTIDRKIRHWMDEGDIPGLTLVMIKDSQTVIRSYGYADLASGTKVTPSTLFEIGSCSKAFTGLAAAQLIDEGKLRMNDTVSHFLPWLQPTYKGKPQAITIAQLLHHTSGIPWKTISKITPSNDPSALEQTIRKLQDQPLRNMPGKRYEYATINYDVVALVIQVITHQPFEQYLQQHILQPLRLDHTTIGQPYDASLKATGYKTGFFAPRKYEAPPFRANNAAGYVISDGRDMARWLQFQLGQGNNEMYALAGLTHQRDETVPLHNMSSYAMGWDVSLSGNGEIYHGGVNPNYTSYVSFNTKRQTGLAVLINSNSNYTRLIGDYLTRLMAGEDVKETYKPEDGQDTAFSLVSIMVGAYLLIATGYLLYLLVLIAKGKRKFTGFSRQKFSKLLFIFLLLLPFVFAAYSLPQVLYSFDWTLLMVWMPVSLPFFLGILIAALAVSYIVYAVSLFFPHSNLFKSKAPQLLLLAILSGLANMAVIILITSSLDSDMALEYLLFYYALVSGVYLLGRRYVQINLIRFSRKLTYDFRVLLLGKIFSTSYQRFEKIDRGRVYTALNDDVGTIGESTNIFISLITSVITAIGAFLYLATIAFWATMLTILLVVMIATVYYFVSKSTKVYFEEARDTQNIFMRLTSGMIDGFKEISLKRRKKIEYRDEVIAVADVYRNKISAASIRFVNAFLIGELMLIFILGSVAFLFPKTFPDIEVHTIRNFIVILLYLVGPVNGILTSIPSIMQVKIAWDRIQKFTREIPSNIDLEAPAAKTAPFVESIQARDLFFQYKNEQGGFAVGPIDFEVSRGEILFIIGGNGSGKTTLAKLVTGLYEPDRGEICINGKPVKPAELSEYFSTVFSPAFLFEKLYSLDLADRSEEVDRYLKMLDLSEKVQIVNNTYSTIDLSGGQRKRLALLQCYMEDSPIYLFDEWAADQDPEYRNFFYRTLLPEMKQKGKIIIAVTHDDHYFDVADRVVKMHQGKLEKYADGLLFTKLEVSKA